MPPVVRPIRRYQPGQAVQVSEENRDDQNLSDEERQADMVQCRQQMEQLMAQAQAEADELLRQATEQAQIIQAEAQAKGYDEGYQQGLADGQQQAEQQMAATVQRIEDLLRSVAQERATVLSQAEPEVVQLAMTIAEKVIGLLAQQHRSVVVHTVAQALDQLTVTGPFRLRVHPDDATYLEVFWQEKAEDVHTLLSQGEPDQWTLVRDPQIEPGGCVVECGPATIDARLSTQIRAIVDALEVEL